MSLRILSLALLAAGSSACQAQPASSASAPGGGQAVSASIRLDVDCDGRKDTVVLSQGLGSATVQVSFADRSRKSVSFAFTVASDRQDAVCAMPVSLEPESLDYDPSEAVGEIPGFVRSKTCMGFAVIDGQCDSLHFFWNHKTKRLEWWRA